MSNDPTPIKRPVRDPWSRTALVGAYAIGGMTILGIAGIAVGLMAGSDIVALAGTYAAIVGTVAGRATGAKGGEA